LYDLRRADDEIFLRGLERLRYVFSDNLGDVPMNAPMTWRVRLRFRLQKKLNIKTNTYRLEVGEREVTLTPPTPDANISDSEWLIMNARGFTSEHEAHVFGRKLKGALEVSAVAARVGVDAGQDLPTSALGRSVRDAILENTGADVRPNIHGLDIFPDDPNTRILTVSATGTVVASPDHFLGDLDELHRAAGTLSQRVADVILLLNYALMQPQPVAQIVFAVSAVESLGQNEVWTVNQKELLRELAAAAEQSAAAVDAERKEVADAIRKSLHRLSLRQGVFRLLDRLNLEHLKTAWDQLYTERSTLVHGLAPKPGADYGDLAHRTVSLCGQILLKAIASEIPQADRRAENMYVA
jgi:hypothetical protein